MKLTKVFLVTTIAALTAVGCVSTGLSPREQTGTDYPALVAALYQQTTSLPPARPLERPVRLAVAQVGEAAPAASFLARLESHSDVVTGASGIPLIGERRSARPDHKHVTDDAQFTRQAASARSLARDLGAEYLLIVGGNIDRYTSKTPASVLDFTLVGSVVSPGARVRVEGKAAGALVEVASGRAVLLASTEIQQTANTPTYFSADKAQAMQFTVRDLLLQQLADEFVRQLRVNAMAIK